MWKNRLAFALLYAALLALLTAGQLGLHMTSGSRAITRRAVAWCLGISAVLCACAVGLSGTEMPSVDRLRQSQKLIFKLISLWGIDAALGRLGGAGRSGPGGVRRARGGGGTVGWKKTKTRRHRVGAFEGRASVFSGSGFGEKNEEKPENAP